MNPGNASVDLCITQRRLHIITAYIFWLLFSDYFEDLYLFLCVLWLYINCLFTGEYWILFGLKSNMIQTIGVRTWWIFSFILPLNIPFLSFSLYLSLRRHLSLVCLLYSMAWVTFRDGSEVSSRMIQGRFMVQTSPIHPPQLSTLRSCLIPGTCNTNNSFTPFSSSYCLLHLFL